MDLVVCSESHLVLDGLTSVLEHGGHTVVARVQHPDEAARACAAVSVDACVLDLGDASPQVRADVEQLRRRHPHLHSVALVAVLDPDTASWAAQVGLDRVLLRSVRSAELLAAVARQPVSRALGPDPRRARTARLSPSEQRVLAGLCEGADTHAIADALGIADSTVRSHIRAIFDKLGVRSRVAAVLVATSLGLCPVGPTEQAPGSESAAHSEAPDHTPQNEEGRTVPHPSTRPSTRRRSSSHPS